jgi:hypothetical protein
MYAVAGQRLAPSKKTPALPGFFVSTTALDQAAFFIVAMSITKR